MKRIGLKDAIGSLREELEESIFAAANEELQFEVGEIALEFQVEVEWSAEVDGKVNFYVFEIGTGGGTSSSNTHKVSIPLKPITQDGQSVLTASSIVPK